MQLKFVLLLVAFALVGAEEEECGRDKAGVCQLKLLSKISEKATDEEDCALIAEASSCLSEAVEDCTGDVRNEELEDRRQFFRFLTVMKCPLKDLSDEVEKCVDDLESELLACIEDNAAEVMKQQMELAYGEEIEEDEIQCKVYASMTKCIATKLGDNCGEDASLAAVAEILDDEELRETCKIPDVKGTSLKGLFFDLEKKKRK